MCSAYGRAQTSAVRARGESGLVQPGDRLDDALGLEDAPALLDAAVQLELCFVDRALIDGGGCHGRGPVMRVDERIQRGARLPRGDECVARALAAVPHGVPEPLGVDDDVRSGG